MVDCIFVEGPITHTHISSIELITEKSVGAVASFNGIVRDDEIEGCKVEGIEFSTDKEIAYPMAIELLKLNRERFSLSEAVIFHSIGYVPAGNRCFKVRVKSAHRKEAFQALEQIVDAFKATIPFFGKEKLENNSHVWKQNNS